jgi:hypothetical protein
MDLNTAAREFVRWAKARRLLGETVGQGEIPLGTTRELFGAVGVQTATQILQDRGISYIGVNDAEQRIYVYCAKAPRVKDRRAFEGTLQGQFPIILTHGEICSSGQIAISSRQPPFVYFNNKYSCGSSIHLSTVPGAGTLGCLVSDQSGQMYGLTNNHVAGDSNYAEIGLPILAPGSIDISVGQPDPFTIGYMYSAGPLVDGIPSRVPVQNNIDSALIRIANGALVTSMQRSVYDTPPSTAPMIPGMLVEKVGRTTGFTRGIVRVRNVISAPVEFYMNNNSLRKMVYFDETFVIEGADGIPFSDRGDSGSLITSVLPDGSRVAVGLLFAGDGNITLALCITRVLTQLGVTLVSGHNA